MRNRELMEQGIPSFIFSYTGQRTGQFISNAFSYRLSERTEDAEEHAVDMMHRRRRLVGSIFEAGYTEFVEVLLDYALYLKHRTGAEDMNDFPYEYRRNLERDKDCSIILNRVQCVRCKDFIRSECRHHYNTCSCGEVSVDGGTDYLKRSVEKNGNGFIEESIVELPEKKEEGG